ncbi:hypothetical protein Sango_0836200 [Sesamum angolense]|uniref:Reverse transcriptase/retrotransposon-derived protein RNase H-like domain-containing protein n=1 Tax=Sesamum angolense TaxID=2727404 RepID=A0AAE2C0N7_9LAMI|nr:hypothetical protein Sango_0836200 [Sesamum angolense]
MVDRNKIEATLKIKRCKYEYVRYKPIQMNMEDKKDMQIIIKEHINLGLIEPGISAYSSPGFLIKMEKSKKLLHSPPQGQYIWNVLPMGIELQEHIVEKIRNFPDVLKDKKQLQSFLGVVNFAGIFIKDLAKYRKDFRPLLKETESAKWKWEEIHTQRVRELKQVCNNLPKLAIPQDEDELVVYTDANDYRWAAVLMKKTTTGKNLVDTQEGCSPNNKPKFLDKRWRELKQTPYAETQAPQRNLEELDREFGRLAVNAQVAGQVQRADLDKVQTNIRSSLVASTALWNALLEPIRKASPSVMTRELREQGSKPALRVQGSKPVAADSSTACTRPSSDSGETATDESQGVKTSDDSSQPSTSGVKEGEISLRPMTGTSKTNTNELSSSPSSAWQDQNPKKFENGMSLELWLQFILCHQVFRKSPNYRNGLVGRYDSWQNNPHLKRGDILELKFISAAPEMAGKGSHPAFHFIKLQRPDMMAFNRIKATTEEAPLVSAISEDDISTRRAWGLRVCLTEMDKVKYPFKIFSNKVNGSFLLKLHDRKEH